VFPNLLTTKFYILPARKNLVPRTRLSHLMVPQEKKHKLVELTRIGHQTLK
jgi:hypothetical protein